MIRLLIPLIIVLALAFYAGYATGSRNQTGPKLSRPERKELTALRALKSTVRKDASQHQLLDSPLAQIILDEVDKTESEIDNARNT